MLNINQLHSSVSPDEGHASTYFVENGSYLKLRSLQLGYTFPEALLTKAHMQNARIYVSGQNLLTIKSRSLSCSDPENPGFAYPTTTSFTMGVQIGF